MNFRIIVNLFFFLKQLKSYWKQTETNLINAILETGTIYAISPFLGSPRKDRIFFPIIKFPKFLTNNLGQK